MKSPPLYLGKWFEEGHTISLDFVATKAALSNSRLHAWLISPAMRIFLFILLNDGINCWGNNCSYHVITFREALSTSVWVFFLGVFFGEQFELQAEEFIGLETFDGEISSSFESIWAHILDFLYVFLDWGHNARSFILSSRWYLVVFLEKQFS